MSYMICVVFVEYTERQKRGEVLVQFLKGIARRRTCISIRTFSNLDLSGHLG